MNATDRYPAAVRIALSLIPAAVPRSLIAPPLHRLSWRAGVALPPPLTAGWLRNFLYFAIVFGLLFALIMGGVLVSLGADPVRLEARIVPAAVSSGLVFGALMAAVFHVNARRHRVPSWEEVRSVQEIPPVP